MRTLWPQSGVIRDNDFELISEVVEIEKAQVRERRNLQVSQTVDETKNWRSTP